MNIKFEGSLTKEEFKNAAKLLNRPVSKKTGLNIEAWIILMIIGFGLIAVGIRLLFVEQNIGTGSLFATVGVVIFSYGMKVRTAIDRAWEESQKNGARYEGTITDEHLEARSSLGNSQTFWTAFSGYGEYRGIIILIQGNTGHPFSSQHFQSQGDWQEFKNFIANKLQLTHKIDVNFWTPANLYVLAIIIFSAIMVILVLLRKEAK
ncbi:MAG: hypothetical protein ABIU06_03985 [Anaerolineales bacterium]